MEDCIFCKIVDKKIPAKIVYEDDVCLAFLDISPAVKGHTLVIPKHHTETLLETPEHILTHLIQVIKKVAEAVVDTTSAEGYNLIQNNGRVAGQVIDHIHFHIIPRFDGDKQDFSWNHLKYQEGEMDEYQKSIAKRIQ